MSMADDDGDLYYQTMKTDMISAASRTRKESISHPHYPAKIATRGLEEINLDVLHQGSIWIDANNKVWSLAELRDSHLDGIITWLDAGRIYLHARASHHPLHRNHAHDMEKMPLWKALIKEQDRRIALGVRRVATPDQVVDMILARIVAARKDRRRGDILTTNLIRSIIISTITEFNYELKPKE